MATNLFEACDSAVAVPRRSLAAALLAGPGRKIDELLARRRRARELRRVRELPPHLLKDIGLVAWGDRLWPTTGNGAGAAEWR